MPIIVIENPDGDWIDAPIYINTPNYDHTDTRNRVDGAANRHDASLYQHGNCSIVYYRITNPAGQLVGRPKNIVMAGTPHTYDVVMTPTTPKTVSFSMAPEGTGMRFNLGGHLANHSANPEATVLVPNVWQPFPAGPHQLEDGKAGAFQPEGGPPPPPEENVDYARIEAIVNFVVSRIVGADQADSLVHKIVGSAPQSLRQALRDDLGKDSDLQLLTGNDAKAQQYKAALFDFTKNASANPWANVLGGLDAWGQARQEELREIIREEVAKAQTVTPKSKKESPAVGTGPKD